MVVFVGAIPLRQTKNMKTKCEIENLRAARAALETLDAVELVGEFREFEHGCSRGTYCALVLDPSDGSTSTVNEASWSCSVNEYFSESGVLSRTTLLSATRAHWSPSPDDGFEWDYDANGYLAPKDDPQGWIVDDADSAAKPAEKILRAKLGDGAEWVEIADPVEFLRANGWESFGISESPVDGWVPEGADDNDVREVEKQITELIESIDAEIEEETA